MNQIAIGDARLIITSAHIWKGLGHPLTAGSHVIACAWTEWQTAAGAGQGHDDIGVTHHTALNTCMHNRNLSGWRASGERGQEEA